MVKIEVPRHASQTQKVMKVRVPDDATEGTEIMAVAPNGVSFKCTVPRGVSAGDIMHVNVPDHIPPPEPEPQGTKIGVRIPEGAKPGQQMKAKSPEGQEFTFTVPEGATPGTVINLAIPPPPAQTTNVPQAASRLRGLVATDGAILAGGPALIESESSTVSGTDIHSPALLARRASNREAPAPTAPPTDLL